MPPVASFDATPTTGTAPLPVTFTDTSTGQITSWQWDFGDGESANTEDSAHTYAGAGTFTAALTVTGPGGTDTTSQQIVVNAPPAVSILAPQDGATFVPDDSVTFTGTATDLEDGDLSAAIAWTLNIDGALGTGASIVNAPSSGTHTITAAVTDSGGATSTESITVTVNAPPGVSITAPQDGATFVPDDPVTFSGTAIDFEDSDLSAAIVWTSNLDGPIGTGATINVTLSSGRHTITLGDRLRRQERLRVDHGRGQRLARGRDHRPREWHDRAIR
jgi:chitodextrinase